MDGRLEARWRERLTPLAGELRATARAAVRSALAAGNLESLSMPVREGAGDTTFRLDECTEQAISRWLDATSRTEALSLLTEDEGWRHRGPDGRGGNRELPGFDHGGPRIAIDPIDGTRHLMSDLRAAWSVISFAPPGEGEPRLSDLTLGICSEIPDSRAARWRCLWALRGGGAFLEERALESVCESAARRLHTGDDSRAERGYFSFFRYLPAQRPRLAAIEAHFFERLARLEGADVRSCYDDQYISSGGQLALLALGTYRLSADLRGWLGAREPRQAAIATHPYDLAGAVLIAREAGVIVDDPSGAPRDFPIDCTTAVSFVAWVNAATRARLHAHLSSALNA
jgi:fructose-1,6-bisphosphatase/inositol monophosphatase family enzyme